MPLGCVVGLVKGKGIGAEIKPPPHSMPRTLHAVERDRFRASGTREGRAGGARPHSLAEALAFARDYEGWAPGFGAGGIDGSPPSRGQVYAPEHTTRVERRKRTC